MLQQIWWASSQWPRSRRRSDSGFQERSQCIGRCIHEKASELRATEQIIRTCSCIKTYHHSFISSSACHILKNSCNFAARPIGGADSIWDCYPPPAIAPLHQRLLPSPSNRSPPSETATLHQWTPPSTWDSSPTPLPSTWCIQFFPQFCRVFPSRKILYIQDRIQYHF